MPPIASDMTGRQLALKLKDASSDSDWIAELARRSGESRDTVKWRLQEDMRPPARISEAAARLMNGAPRFQHATAPPPDCDAAPDDLPFAGVPQILGKLHED